MIVASVTFGPRLKQPNSKKELEDTATFYLSALIRNGQLDSDFFLTWTDGVLNAHVRLAARSASDFRYHSIEGRKKLREILAAFGKKPLWKVLDDDAKSRPQSWKGAPFLYLFTHAFDEGSPVCRGDGKPAVPVYTLPISFAEKEELYLWQRSYYLHDNLWLECRALELPAYRQLADPQSELSRRGRDLCKVLEAATGIPTYYYLQRYWGRKKGEEARRCPACGEAWRTIRQPQQSALFWQFEFQCRPCRLVSQAGVSTDGGPRTAIGEFQRSKS